MDTYEKKYKEAIERAKLYKGLQAEMEFIFPELKESEDEKIRKGIIKYLEQSQFGEEPYQIDDDVVRNYIAWLEKQSEQNSTSYMEIRKSVCREIAVSLIKYLDDNRIEGYMDLSSVECEDLENAVVNSDWKKIYNYMSKKFEKQGEENKNQEKKNCHKFNIGDIISNGKAVYRVDDIRKNCLRQDCYFLVNIESEKDGTRYLIMCDSYGKISNMGEVTWLCEEVDESFEKQDEQKPV